MAIFGLAIGACLLFMTHAAKLDIECRGEGDVIRDDRDMCSYWRCVRNDKDVLVAEQVACDYGLRLTCTFGQGESDSCLADPCSVQNYGNCAASSVCPEHYEPPEDKKSLFGESVQSYIDYCQPSTGQVDEIALSGRTSMRCDPPEARLECNEPLTGYVVDAESGECIKSKSCDYDHVFESLEECQFTCDDACSQKPDAGSRDCRYPTPFKAVYFDEASGTCRQFFYNGCGGNKNRFESVDECEKLCRFEGEARATTTSTTTQAPIIREPILTRRLARQVEEINDDGQSRENNADIRLFCAEFEKNYPSVVENLKSIDEIASTQTNPLGITDLAKQVDEQIEFAADGSSSESLAVRKRRQFNPLGLHLRRLHWATVVRKKNCKTFDVTIRIFCVKSLFRSPSTSEKNRLCKLIKQGIEKYWSRTITYSGSTWTVNVKVKERFFLSKKIIIKYYTTNTGNTRSHNSDILPMTMKYHAFLSNPAVADERFAETAAHELGHSVLMNDKGLVWSWGHKGTSTIFGTIKSPPATTHPLSGEIDLMKYYTNAQPSDFYDRVVATESDVKALINEATFYWPWGFCLGVNGAPCLLDKHCYSGHCHWLRCVECESNSHCASGEYCHGINNPFVLNTCRAKRNIGEFCIRDSMCKSNMCDGARCVECEQDHHCAPTQYCRGKNNPLILNSCTNKKPNGGWCLRDAVCASGHCQGGRCVACESDSHCPHTAYCWGMNLPLVVNECRSRKSVGGWCTRDRECALGHCDGGRCGECESDSHCPGGYCKNKNLPLITNVCRGKKCTGWCSRDAMCKSGKCRWYLRCKKC